jgi:hypothetical protein
MEIVIIRLKNIKYLFIVEKLRGITATLNAWASSGDFASCFFYSLFLEKLKYRIICTKKLSY